MYRLDNINLVNSDRIATEEHQFNFNLYDHDGSLTGYPDSMVSRLQFKVYADVMSGGSGVGGS